MSNVAGERKTAEARTPAEAGELLATAIETLEIEGRAVLALASRLGDEWVAAARTVLSCSGRVVLTGVGKSGAVARKIASTLASTGTPALFLHPTEGAHGDVGVLVEGDVLLVVSKSGEGDELAALLPAVRAVGAPILAITGTPTSALAGMADIVLDASVAGEACPHDMAPTASSTAALALGDALAMTVMRARGLGEDDVARLHPGGSIGRRLLWTVGDVMVAGADVAQARQDETLREAMSLIAHRRGTVAVIEEDGRLTGVLTAGDLTRFAGEREDFLGRPISEAMNPDPRWTTADARASTVLAEMERHGIMAMPVLEGGRVRGMVHLHDLLRAGVRA